MLIDKGLKKEEIKEILMQIFVVSYGTEHVTTKVNSLNIVSPFDEKFHKVGEENWKRFMTNFINFHGKETDLGKEIKISEKDRNALLKICNSKYPKIELKKFYYFNDRCYVMKEDNKLYLLTSLLNINKHDHDIVQFRHNQDNTQNEVATKTGHFVGKCMACAFQYSVNNSYLNTQTERLVPFNSNELKNNLEEIAFSLNDQPLYKSNDGNLGIDKN